MKHKKAIVIFLLVTLLIAGTLCAMLIQSSREELNVRKSNSNMDYATQFVIDNKLLQVCDYPIGESSISVTGYYYDGVRLYLRVSSSNDVLDDTGTDDFKLLSNGHTYLPHTALMIDDIDGLGNMTTKMLIFNTMIEANLDDMALAFQLDNETNSFSAEVLYALKDFLIKRFGSLLEHTTLHTEERRPNYEQKRRNHCSL